MAKNTLETAKPKAYGRRVKDIPQEYRIPEIDYNKHANDVIYVDAKGKPIEGNPRETHDVSNVTWYTPQTKSAIYDNNEQQISKSEQKRVERISKKEQINQDIKDKTRTLADFTPGLGDFLQAKDAYNALRSGNRQEAGILLASLLVPNIIEKPIKYAGKSLKNIYKAINNKKQLYLPNTTVQRRRTLGDYEVGQQLTLNQILSDKEIKSIRNFNKDIDKRLRNSLSDEGYLMNNEEKKISKDNVIDDIKYYIAPPDYKNAAAFSDSDGNIGFPINMFNSTRLKNNNILAHELEHSQRMFLRDAAETSRIRDRHVNNNITQKSINPIYQYGELATYTPKEAKLLDDAYSFTDEFLQHKDNKNLSPLLEKGATNREMRYRISSRNGDIIGKELDDYIDNMSDDHIMYILAGDEANGYGQNFYNKIEQQFNKLDDDGYKRFKKEKAKQIKEALKYVPAIAPIAIGVRKSLED